jgi:hypothetical protein
MNRDLTYPEHEKLARLKDEYNTVVAFLTFQDTQNQTTTSEEDKNKKIYHYLGINYETIQLEKAQMAVEQLKCRTDKCNNFKTDSNLFKGNYCLSCESKMTYFYCGEPKPVTLENIVDLENIVAELSRRGEFNDRNRWKLFALSSFKLLANPAKSSSQVDSIVSTIARACIFLELEELNNLFIGLVTESINECQKPSGLKRISEGCGSIASVLANRVSKEFIQKALNLISQVPKGTKLPDRLNELFYDLKNRYY